MITRLSRTFFVDQSYVIKPQLFKHHTFQYEAPGVFVNPLVEQLHLLWEALIETLGEMKKFLKQLGY